MRTTLEDAYVGLPPDVIQALAASGAAGAKRDRASVWDEHYWLFMTILIFILCAVFISLICCCCLWARRGGDSPPTAKQTPTTPTTVSLTPSLPPPFYPTSNRSLHFSNLLLSVGEVQGR